MVLSALMTEPNKRTKNDLETIIYYLKKLPLFEEEINDLREQRGIYHILSSLASKIEYLK